MVGDIAMDYTFYSDTKWISEERKRAGGAVIRWWARRQDPGNFIALNLPGFLIQGLESMTSLLPLKEWLGTFIDVYEQERRIWIYEMSLKIAKSINCQLSLRRIATILPPLINTASTF